MASVFDKLVGKQLITDYPGFLKNNIHYEAMVGSVSYGASTNFSDCDVMGFAMPPRHILFPYHYGHVFGFGKQPEVFNQFQKHHIMDKDTGSEYDISIYNIVRFFQLCMESNPNMVDSLFVRQNCVLSCSPMGEYVRENRKLFLSKLSWHKFKGYAFSQLSKMKDKAGKEFVDLCKANGWPIDVLWHDIEDEVGSDSQARRIFQRVDQSGQRSKRLKTIAKYGYDVKFAYNVVRLLEEVHQILEEGDLDLMRSKDMYKQIRNGEWPQEKIQEFFDDKYPILERAYENSKLPFSPREDEIRELLSECIHMHYGDIGIGSAPISLDSNVQKLALSLQNDVDRLVRLINNNG